MFKIELDSVQSSCAIMVKKKLQRMTLDACCKEMAKKYAMTSSQIFIRQQQQH